MNSHTTFKLHRRVYVVLNSGESFVDRVAEQRSGAYVFRDRGRVTARAIRTMSYYRASARG